MCHTELGARHFHPYEIKLQELLTKEGFHVKAHQRGISGERVIDEMETRLPHLLQSAQAHGIRFSWVVVLGGINDLGHGADPQRVFKGLQSLYGASRQHGARVLALTCLETAFGKKWPDMDVPRKYLNKLIRGAVAGGEDITLLDAEQLLPYPRDPADAEAAALWDDGLHLSPAGYDRLGQYVFDALKDKLGKA